VSRSGSTTRDRSAGSRRSAARRSSPVPSLPSRRRERPRRPHRRHRRLLQLAAVAVVVTAVCWALLASPLLGVRTVQVDGLTTLPADQVREAAGVEPGTPLLGVDVDAARARVARLPQVASVEVTRGWPHSVVITVVERVPVAVVGEPGSRSLVDADGVLFDTVTGEPPPGVVALEVAEPGPDDPATAAGVEAVGALPAALRERVAVAAVADPGDISLTLADGTVVEWGGPEESAAKAATLVALLEQLAAGSLEPAATIDVSTPDAVVLR
jgi:cell division protein FtsQ